MNTEAVHILLVEDNGGDARLIREMLIEAGIEQLELTHVERLADAFEHLEHERVDVLLLDLSLPDSAGLDTVLRVHERAAQVPVVVLTGTNDGVLAINAVQAGVQDYLVKGDTDSEGLLRSLRYAMERKRAEQAVQNHPADPAQLQQVVDRLAHPVGGRLDDLAKLGDLKSPLVTFPGFIHHIRGDAEAGRSPRCHGAEAHGG